MNLSRIVRNSVAGALIAATPIATTVAAVRPNAAVPAAGSTAVTAQAYQDDDDGFAVPWLAVGVVGVALAVMLWIAIDDDGDGEGSISKG